MRSRYVSVGVWYWGWSGTGLAHDMPHVACYRVHWYRITCIESPASVSLVATGP
jgi:hypothetical protein